MRLFSGKVGVIATECVRALVANKEIEAESPNEVELDITSVLNNYLRLEQEATQLAKDYIQQHSMAPTELGRLKKAAAEKKGIKIGEDTLDYLLDQVVEMLLHSANVDEVFAQDHELRRRMAPVFKKHMAADEDLEREVRGQLKHVREGTATWDIEYQRLMGDIKRRKGLS